MLAVVALQKLWSRSCSESKTCHQQNSHSDPKNLCGMFAVVKIWDLESTFKTSIYTHIYIYSNYNQLLPTLFGIKIDKTSLSARHSQYIYTELWWSQDHTSCISCPPTPLSLTLFRRVSYLRPLGKQLHSGKFFCFFQGFPGSMWFFPRNQQLEWKIQPPLKKNLVGSPPQLEMELLPFQVKQKLPGGWTKINLENMIVKIQNGNLPQEMIKRTGNSNAVTTVADFELIILLVKDYSMMSRQENIGGWVKYTWFNRKKSYTY